MSAKGHKTKREETAQNQECTGNATCNLPLRRDLLWAKSEFRVLKQIDNI